MGEVILGIDVGFAICGWSIVEKDSKHKNGMKLIDFGAILTSSKDTISSRLNQVADGLERIIAEYKPDTMSVEDLFYFKNQKTVIAVAQVRGVILLVGERNHLNIYSYTPLQVKVAVTGYGRADKKDVQRMVQMIFCLKEIPKPDDAADAVAVALCHCNNSQILK